MEIKDSNSKYHGSDGYSSTRLKPGKDSMKHYKDALGVKLRGDALDFGSLVHCVYLEPETLQDAFIIYDETDKPTKHKMTAQKNAAWLEEMRNKAELEGLDGVISKEQVLQAVNMKEAAFSDPVIEACFLNENGQPEISLYQEMEVKNLATGRMEKIKVKARPDLRITDCPCFGNLIVDIKSVGKSGGASLKSFSKIIEERAYDLSAAYYIDIQKFEDKEQGIYREWNFAWFVQETIPPYHYNFIYATQEHLQNGRKDYQNILSNIRTSEFLNFWPSYRGYSEFIGSQAPAPPRWRKEASLMDIETIRALLNQ